MGEGTDFQPEQKRGWARRKKSKIVCRLGVMFIVLLQLVAQPKGHATSFTFSDRDFLGGAAWGTMTLTALDHNTLQIRYDAASAAFIPQYSQVTGFSFYFDNSVNMVRNPLNQDYSGDRDDLNWKKLMNLNAIPNPDNGDEFDPEVNKFSYNFGVTEGNPRNFNGPGIRPGESDIFYLDFGSESLDMTSLILEDFAEHVGIRLQNLPCWINGGSLFLNGEADSTGPVPEPTTMLLFGTGVALLLGFSKRIIRH